VLALTPNRFEGMAMPPESYSVALVAPSAVGGTHLPGPLGKRPESPAPVVPRQPAHPSKSAADVVNEAPAAPAQAAEPPQPKPLLPVEPPEAAKASELKSPPAEQEDTAPAPADKKPKVPVASSTDVRLKPDKQESSPPRPEEPAREEEKAPAKPEKSEAKPVAKLQKPEAKPVAKKEHPARSTETTKKWTKEPTDLDKQIAAAVQRRAGAVDAESKQQGEIDHQIAEAVQRRTMNAARAASGIGSSTSPVPGVGPGSGAGGVLRGIEYVMYRNQMESRIKAAWVWAGADRSLRAVIRFNVTPEGRIVNVTTVHPSGDASYDASVERAIRSADPLGAPPERYRDEFGTVELEFRAEDARG
jgi:colicin import membrane protein